MQNEIESNRLKDDAFQSSVAVIGGGLAGISAALEARKRGARVVVFERKKRLGGRASSVKFDRLNAREDFGFHSFRADSRSLLRLNDELGLNDAFDSIPSTFDVCGLEKSGSSSNRNVKSWTLKGSALAPSGMRLLPSILKFPPLSIPERWNLFKTCQKVRASSGGSGKFGGREDSVENALKLFGASNEELSAFWNPATLISSCETSDLASCAVLKKIADDFLSELESPSFAPNRPLYEIYHERTLAALERLGVETRFFSAVSKFEIEETQDENSERKTRRIAGLVVGDSVEKFDRYVLAVDPFSANGILENSSLDDLAETVKIENYEYGSVTAVHFWLSRPLTDKRVVALAGKPAQRLVTSPDLQDLPVKEGRAGYCQALIYASHRILSDEEFVARGSEALVKRVWDQVSLCFGGASDVEVLASRVTTALDAVISPNARFLNSRPPQKTACPNLALAGDWTDVGLISSMEGAVLSGVKAIEVLLDR